MRLRWLHNLTIELETMFLMGLVTSSVFWGMVAALVSYFGFDVDFATMRAAAVEPDGPLELFYAINYVALLAYPFLVLGRATSFLVEKHVLKWPTIDHVWLSLIYGLQANVVNPFRGLRAWHVHRTVSRRGHSETGIRGAYGTFLSILHVVWTVLLLIYLIGGFALVLAG